jgi:DNA-binding NtrC family response regulator
MDPTKKLHTSDEPGPIPTNGSLRPPLEDRTLLVADDEDCARDPIVALLERSGFNILTANDCHDAVKVFRDHADTIVLVLLDYSMPGGRGDEVFQELQLIRPDIPVILMSGYTEEDVTGRFNGLGIVGFLQKPFGRAKLLETVHEAIDPPAA